jgi:hypothetical protein
MILYCWALSFLSWLKMGWPYIDGHDWVQGEDKELECRRCHAIEHWFVPAVGGGLVCENCGKTKDA